MRGGRGIPGTQLRSAGAAHTTVTTDGTSDRGSRGSERLLDGRRHIEVLICLFVEKAW